MNPIDTLSPAQHAVLAYAINNTNGKIDWYPAHIKGGARAKVLQGLCKLALIREDAAQWWVSAAGYAALGVATNAPTAAPEPGAATTAACTAQTASVGPAEAACAASGAASGAQCGAQPALSAKRAPRSRDNSKQADVIRMLARPQGATVEQICAATGWLPHTVRGTFAGALKKKLGLSIISDKVPGSARIYRTVV